MPGLYVDGKPVRKIVVSRLRFMGDVILTTPLLRALKAADPQVQIAYLVEEEYAPILWHHPHVDEIWTVRRRPGGLRGEWRQVRQMRRKMREFGPDATIDLLGMPRSAFLLYLSGAPIRVGGPHRVRRRLYTHVVEHGEPQVSAIHYHLESLQPFGLSREWTEEDLRTYVHLQPKETDWADKYLAHIARGQRPVIGLHPGATWPAKRWFPERFGQLARELRQKLGAQVLITTGPGEQWLQSEVYDAAEGAAIPLPVLKLRLLAALLARLDIFVTNDCGPMHLSVAVGTPTIGLFGPGEPNIWFPYQETRGHRALHHPCPLHPCHRDVCDDMTCFRDLEVDEVFEAVAWALENARRRAAASE